MTQVATPETAWSAKLLRDLAACEDADVYVGTGKPSTWPAVMRHEVRPGPPGDMVTLGRYGDLVVGFEADRPAKLTMQIGSDRIPGTLELLPGKRTYAIQDRYYLPLVGLRFHEARVSWEPPEAHVYELHAVLGNTERRELCERTCGGTYMRLLDGGASTGLDSGFGIFVSGMFGLAKDPNPHFTAEFPPAPGAGVPQGTAPDWFKGDDPLDRSWLSL